MRQRFGTGSVLWEKALKPFWFLDFDDLALKWLKSLPDKSFSRIIPPGGTSALCVDKTGTLTLNQMAVQQLLAYDLTDPSLANAYTYDLGVQAQAPLPEAVHELVKFCILASQRDPFDPMEKAFSQLGDRPSKSS